VNEVERACALRDSLVIKFAEAVNVLNGYNPVPLATIMAGPVLEATLRVLVKVFPEAVWHYNFQGLPDSLTVSIYCVLNRHTVALFLAPNPDNAVMAVLLRGDSPDEFTILTDTKTWLSDADVTCGGIAGCVSWFKSLAEEASR
jgi:hypothetical protein